MRIDRSHIPWALITILLGVASWLGYLAQFQPEAMPIKFTLPAFMREAPSGRATIGGTPIGLLYGTIALLIFLFAAALGLRKSKRFGRPGTVNFWLKAHIWFTLLTIPLVLFHCGFNFGQGHSQWLMWMYWIVMGTGIYGVLLQHYMPGVMRSQLPREVVYEQIPNLRKRIYEQALQMRGQLLFGIAAPDSKGSGHESHSLAERLSAAAMKVQSSDSQSVEAQSNIALVKFLDEELLPYLRNPKTTSSRLANPRVSTDVCRLLRLNIAETFRPRVDEIEAWADDMRIMTTQERLHWLLHSWLLIHVPLSLALIVWTIWHAWVVWQYM